MAATTQQPQSVSSISLWTTDPKKLDMLKMGAISVFAAGIILSGCFFGAVLEIEAIYAGIGLCVASGAAICEINRLLAVKQVKEANEEFVVAAAGLFDGDELSSTKKTYTSTGNMDKVFKMLNWGPKFVAQAIETETGSPQVVDGLRNMASDFVQIRNGVGLFNALQSIPKLIYVWHDFASACQGYELLKPDPLTGAIKKTKITELSPAKRALLIASKGFKFLEWIAFNICFVVCAPAMWLNGWFKLGTHAKEVGSQFTLFFLMKDIFLITGSYADLAYKKVNLDESLAQANSNASEDNQKALVAAYVKRVNDYRQAQFDTAITTIKSGADISLGLMGILKVKTNPWITLSLGMVSSVVGIYEIWRDTKPGKAGVKRQTMPPCFLLSPDYVMPAPKPRPVVAASIASSASGSPSLQEFQ